MLRIIITIPSLFLLSYRDTIVIRSHCDRYSRRRCHAVAALALLAHSRSIFAIPTGRGYASRMIGAIKQRRSLPVHRRFVAGPRFRARIKKQLRENIRRSNRRSITYALPNRREKKRRKRRIASIVVTNSLRVAAERRG